MWVLAQAAEIIGGIGKMSEQAEGRSDMAWIFFVVVVAWLLKWGVEFWFVTLPSSRSEQDNKKVLGECIQKLTVTSAKTEQMVERIHDNSEAGQKLTPIFIAIAQKVQNAINALSPPGKPVIDVNEEIHQLKGATK